MIDTYMNKSVELHYLPTSDGIKKLISILPIVTPKLRKETSDLISRTQAIDEIHEDAEWLASQGSDWQVERMERDKSILMSLPSAQPEIIHCKDCAYCDSDVVDAPYGMTKKIFWCDRLYAGANENLVVDPDDFCSWAERREVTE
jgi:hypothetical protein